MKKKMLLLVLAVIASMVMMGFGNENIQNTSAKGGK